MGSLRTSLLSSTAEGPPKEFFDLLAVLIMRGSAEVALAAAAAAATCAMGCCFCLSAGPFPLSSCIPRAHASSAHMNCLFMFALLIRH